MSLFPNSYISTSGKLCNEWLGYNIISVGHLKIISLAFKYFFRFRDLGISMHMNKNPADIIQNSYYWTPNYNLFKALLGYFTPENSIVVIGANDVKISRNVKSPKNFTIVKKIKEVSADLEIPTPVLEYFEEKYSTHFTIYEIPPALYGFWKSTRNIETMDLPVYNEFIPSEENFSALPPQTQLNKPMRLISGNPAAVEIWVLAHTNWKSPSITVTCALESKFVETNIQTAGINKLFLLFW